MLRSAARRGSSPPLRIGGPASHAVDLSLARHAVALSLARPPKRCFRSSPTPCLFGLKLPEPSNEPLAGTLPDSGGPPWLFLLQVVLGLPAALWIYKCLMLVLFQRRIIYLPSVPPGSRNESLAGGERAPAVDASLNGLDWREVRVQSAVPTRWLRRPVELRGIEMSWSGARSRDVKEVRDKVVVVYLQGNAGTPVLRAPLFRSFLREPPTSASSRIASAAESPQPHISVLAVAPRTFWLSTRTTPTEDGVLADYAAALAHAYAEHGPLARYVLYGHSLGGAAAVLLLEKLGQAPFRPAFASSGSPEPATLGPAPASKPPTHTDSVDSSFPTRASTGVVPHVSGVILENPLPSIPYMVRALYPQRWLPYHYLGPLAFDKWDAIGRLERLPAPRRAAGASERARAPRSLWIRSARDEIIPHGGGEGDGVRRMFDAWVLYDAAAAAQKGCAGADARNRWVEVKGALHDTAYLERRWRDEIRAFLGQVARGERG
ncbi:hypothetical protein JCM3770_000739 [Rhodotorula araucariae]